LLPFTPTWTLALPPPIHKHTVNAGIKILSSLAVTTSSRGQEVPYVLCCLPACSRPPKTGQHATCPYAEPDKRSPCFLIMIVCISEHVAAQLGEALRYKPEGRRFGFRWFHLSFSLT
jgi:hypothetical protein